MDMMRSRVSRALRGVRDEGYQEAYMCNNEFRIYS
jgi:hypothetical protein